MKTTVTTTHDRESISFDRTENGRHYRTSKDVMAIAVINLGHCSGSGTSFRALWFHPNGANTINILSDSEAANVMVTAFLPGEKLIHEFE